MADIDFTVEIDGVNSLMRQFSGWLQIATREEADALHADLEDLLDIIKSEYVPVEEGELRDSGFVGDVEQQGDGFEIAFGFTADHATIQHERLDYNHPNGGQAKFVEEPLAEYLDVYIRRRESQTR